MARTGIPMFCVLDADYSTYNGKGKPWPLPKRHDKGEWLDGDDVEPGDVLCMDNGQRLGVKSGGIGGFFLTNPVHLMSWYRPGARLFLAEGSGAAHRRGQHIMYKRARLIREIDLTDEMVETWPQIYLFCAATARDRGEIDRIRCGGMNFSRVNFFGLDLSGSDFAHCKFYGADLQNCCFDGANMEGASFWRADLYDASFKGANLRNSEMRQANLFYADFTGANLQGVRHPLAQIGYTVLKDSVGLETIKPLEVPEELREAAEALHAAGFAVVSGDQEAHQALGEYDTDGDGVTDVNNYQAEIQEDKGP